MTDPESEPRTPSSGAGDADPSTDPTGSGADTRPAWRRRLAKILDRGLWLLVIGVVLWRFGPQIGAAIGIGGTDEPAPDFAVETLDGDTVRLSDLRGQVVLVNFWATWCPPCRLEMPGFQDVWEDYGGRGLTILGLSVDRGIRSEVVRWVRQREITYPIGFPTGATVRAYGGANVLPTSILINREGRIVHRVEGFYAEPALRAAVRRLLE
ncbi:MAG: redoxin domain-containing protein [Candidatus Longimicrobiales bacterium M2_2A_002]